MLQKNSGSKKKPLYVQLKEIWLEKIQSGEWKPGHAIPPEPALGQEHGVSRATVRQAVSELVNEGYLERTQGRGTFVQKAKIETKLNQLYSFSQEARKKGIESNSELIMFEIVLPESLVRQKLTLPPDALVYKLVRLRSADDETYMLETTYLPFDRFPDLKEENVRTVESLYQLLEDKFGVIVDHALEYFQPILADPYAAKMLEVPKNSTALYIERIGYTKQNEILEFTQSVTRGDRCIYVVELLRD